VDSASRYPAMTYQPAVPVLEFLAGQLSYITVGLNAWVITNLAREGRQSRRESYVELHHDGSLAFAVNLSQFTLRDGKDPPPGVAVINPDVVEQACVDLEALLLQVLRTGRVDSPMLVQVSVASKGRLPVTYVTREFGRYGDTRVLPRLRPVTVEIPAGATEEETKPAAAELTAGVLKPVRPRLPAVAVRPVDAHTRGGQAGWSWWQQPWPRDRNGIGAAGLGPDRLPGSAAGCMQPARQGRPGP